MQICGHCGYERKPIEDILDPRSCPYCGIVYEKWRAGTFAQTNPQQSIFQRSESKREIEFPDEREDNKRPFAKYLAALSLVMFAAIVVMSVVVMYKSQNPYSVMNRQATAVAIAGIGFAILALTGVSRYGASGIVAPAVLGIVFNAGWIAIADPVLSKVTTDEYKIERAAAAMDARCPVVLRGARINAVYFEPANKITMSTTMLQIAWKDLPGYGRDDVMQMVKSQIIRHIEQDERLYRFYNKVDWTCIIKTNDDIEYLRIRITPSDFM